MSDADLYPFAQRQAQIERRKAMLAQAMRNQRTGYEQDPGRMVAGRYLAPSWSQNLARLVAPMADRQRVDQLGQEVAADEQEYAEADRKAAIAHAMARPQGTPAQFTLPADQAGPSIPAQQPTTQDMSAWAQQGAAIPSRRDVVAKLMADIEVNEPIRQEARTQRNQDREDRQAEAEKLRRMQEAEYERQRIERGEQMAVDRVEKEARDKREEQLRRDLSNESNQTRRMVIQAQIDKAEAKAAADPKTTESERSSAGYLNRMREAEKTLAGIEGGDLNLAQRGVGGIPMVGKTLQPYVMGQNKQKQLQAQRDWVRAKLRKESGAVIGDEEMAEEIRTYFPQPGEDSEVALQKAASRKAAERQLEISSGGALRQAHPSGATGSWEAPAPAAIPKGWSVKTR